MLAQNLLNEIGFTDKQQAHYFEYKKLIGNKLDSIAKDYMSGDISFSEAIKLTHSFEDEELHKFILNLLFVLECTSYLLEKYNEKGIAKEIFINSMKDLKYKLDECISTQKIYGTNVVEWYERFLDIRRVALGRLQFNIAAFEENPTTICGHTIKKGDFVIACHIPSSGPLKPEMCEESFKMAYEFFKDKASDGILVITCESWLLYPPYKKIFGDKSNTAKFIKNFKIIKDFKTETFEDAWRIFGVDYDGDVEKLPANTSMQRTFIDYIKENEDFGTSLGVILLDGSRILTKE